MKSVSHGAKVLVDPLWLKKKVNRIGTTGESLVLYNLIDYITDWATRNARTSLQTSGDLDNVEICNKHEQMNNTCIRRPTKFQLLQSRFMNPNHKSSMKKQRDVGKLIYKEKPSTIRISVNNPVNKLDLSKYQNVKKETNALPVQNDKILYNKSNGKSRVKSILKTFIAAEENGSKDNPSRMTNVKRNSPKILNRNTIISVLKEKFEQNPTICSVREVKSSSVPKHKMNGKPPTRKNVNKAEVKVLQIPIMDLKYLPTPTYEHASLAEQTLVVHVVKKSTVHGPVAWMMCDTEENKSESSCRQPHNNNQITNGVKEEIPKNDTNELLHSKANAHDFYGVVIPNDKGLVKELCQGGLDKNNDHSVFESSPIPEKNNRLPRTTSVTGNDVEHQMMNGHLTETPEMSNDAVGNMLIEKECEARKITVSHPIDACQEENLLDNYLDTQNNIQIHYDQRKNEEISEVMHSENHNNCKFNKKKGDMKTNGQSLESPVGENESVLNKSNTEEKIAEETVENETNGRFHTLSKEKNNEENEKDTEKYTVKDNKHILDVNNVIYKKVSDDSPYIHSKCDSERSKAEKDNGNELILTKTNNEQLYKKETTEQVGELHHCKSKNNPKNEDTETQRVSDNKPSLDNNNIQYTEESKESKEHSKEEQLLKSRVYSPNKSKSYEKNEEQQNHEVDDKTYTLQNTAKYPSKNCPKNEVMETQRVSDKKPSHDNNNIQYTEESKDHSKEEQLLTSRVYSPNKRKSYEKNEVQRKYEVGDKTYTLQNNAKYPEQSEENPAEDHLDILSKCDNAARKEEKNVNNQVKHIDYTTNNELMEKTKSHRFKQENSKSHNPNKEHSVENSKKRIQENEPNMSERETKQKLGTSNDSVNSVSQKYNAPTRIMTTFNTQRKEVKHDKVNDIKVPVDTDRQGMVKDSQHPLASGHSQLVDNEIKFRKKSSKSDGKYDISYAAIYCLSCEDVLEDILSLQNLKREATINTEPLVPLEIATCKTIAIQTENPCLPETSSMDIHHISLPEHYKNHEELSGESSTKPIKHHIPQQLVKESTRQKRSKPTEKDTQKGDGEDAKLCGNQACPKYQHSSSTAPSTLEVSRRKYSTTAESSKYKVQSYQDTKMSSKQSFKPLVITANDTFNHYTRCFRHNSE